MINAPQASIKNELLDACLFDNNLIYKTLFYSIFEKYFEYESGSIFAPNQGYGGERAATGTTRATGATGFERPGTAGSDFAQWPQRCGCGFTYRIASRPGGFAFQIDALDAQ